MADQPLEGSARAAQRCPECDVGLGPQAEYCPVCGAALHPAEGVGAEAAPAADDGAELLPVPRSLIHHGQPAGGDGSEVPAEGDEAPGETGDYDALDEPDLDVYDEPEPWEFEEPDEAEPRHKPSHLRTFLSIAGVVVAVVLMVVLTLPMSSTSGRAPVVFGTPAGLYPSEVASAEVTQREILDKANELGITAWTNWTPTFNEDGTLSQESADQACNLLNLYRFVAGVEPVAVSPEHDAQAQAVVDVYAQTEFQAHDITVRPPFMDDATFAMAQEAARLSNVGVGYGNWGQDLPAYIAEVDANPNRPNYETVGHRRHLLGTSLGPVGFGLNGRYSAIYVGDFDGGRIDETVVWPATETPYGLWTQGTPWSVSLPFAVEEGDVSVRLTRVRDGRTWGMDDFEHFFVDNGSYHDVSSIVFCPTDLVVGWGDRFEVVVEGLPNGTLSYPVEFFDIGFELAR